MANPLLIAFRTGATIMAAVFAFDWLFEPSELTLEDSREWEVSTHSFFDKSGRTTLLLSSAQGWQVRLNCETYSELCTHVRSRGVSGLKVWVGDLGYFKSPSLLQAQASGTDIVSLSSQQEAYARHAFSRAAPKIFFLFLAMSAWFGPRLWAAARRRDAA